MSLPAHYVSTTAAACQLLSPRHKGPGHGCQMPRTPPREIFYYRPFFFLNFITFQNKQTKTNNNHHHRKSNIEKVNRVACGELKKRFSYDSLHIAPAGPNTRKHWGEWFNPYFTGVLKYRDNWDESEVFSYKNLGFNVKYCKQKEIKVVLSKALERH